MLRAGEAEKRNDLPVWEVEAHAAREPGALVDEYYEGADVGTHHLGVCQVAEKTQTHAPPRSTATTRDEPSDTVPACCRVREIWRYPVKSLGGERLDRADIGALGIEGDRAWGLYDPASDTVLTARREPALLFLRAQIDEGRPVITCDDGGRLTTDADLSNWMGRPVELRSAESGPGTFENPMDADNETDWVRWQSSGDTFHDGRSKISFVSVASLGGWDQRRFRINLILDGSGEDGLQGHVAVGSTVLAVRKPIERCVMVTHAQPGLPKDITVLKRVIAERNNQLGIGAVVTTSGTINTGDPFG